VLPFFSQVLKRNGGQPPFPISQGKGRRYGPMAKQVRNGLIVVLTCFLATLTSANDLKIELEKIKSPSVKYSNYKNLTSFPIPVVSFKRSGLASGSEEMNEIIEKIIYPIINESPDPISTMIIEYFPHLPGKIGVEIYWVNGGMRGGLIEKLADGHYDPRAYKIFFKKPTP
jgi:hypothetical protein